MRARPAFWWQEWKRAGKRAVACLLILLQGGWNAGMPPPLFCLIPITNQHPDLILKKGAVLRGESSVCGLFTLLKRTGGMPESGGRLTHHVCLSQFQQHQRLVAEGLIGRAPRLHCISHTGARAVSSTLQEHDGAGCMLLSQRNHKTGCYPPSLPCYASCGCKDDQEVLQKNKITLGLFIALIKPWYFPSALRPKCRTQVC